MKQTNTHSHRPSAAKRTLGVVLSLLLVLGLFGMDAAVLPAVNADVDYLSGTYCSDLTFIVPEVIYLAPDATSWKYDTSTPFQFYVNNNKDGSPKANAAETTGYIYYKLNGATDFEISAVSVSDPTSSTGLGGSVTVSSPLAPDANGVITRTIEGTSPQLAANTSGYYIRWCLQYKDAGANNAVRRAYAWTYVYKPYVVPIAAASFAGTGGTTKNWAGSLTWLSGFHSITVDGMPNYTDHSFDTYEANNYLRTDRFAAFISSSNTAYISGTPITVNSGAMGKDPDSWAEHDASRAGDRRYVSFYQTGDTNGNVMKGSNTNPADYNHSSAGSDTYNVKSTTTGKYSENRENIVTKVTAKSTGNIIIDTSRYQNLNQIPNLAVGLMVTSDESSEGNTGHWWVADISVANWDHRSTWYKSSESPDTYVHEGDYIFAGQGDNYHDSGYDETEGIRYAGGWNRTLLDTSTSGRWYYVKGVYGNYDTPTIGNTKYYPNALGYIGLYATYYNKANLRTAVQNATRMMPTFGVTGIGNGKLTTADSRLNDITPWKSFANAYIAAVTSLVNVDKSSAIGDPDTLAANLNSTLNALLQSYVPGHALVKTDAKAATCTETGNEEYYTCSRCHKIFKDENGTLETTVSERTISALGHDLTPVAANSPTCTEDGNVAYYVCSRCSKLFLDAAGNNETTAAAVKVTRLGHDYQTVVTDPKCTEGGYTTYTCSRCGDSYVGDEVPPAGHTPGEPQRENYVAGTCVSPATWNDVVYCSVCRAKLSTTPRTGTTDPNNHVGETEVVGAKAATCKETGYTGDVVCKSCNQIKTPGSEIDKDPNNHAGGTQTETKNHVTATCVTPGSYDEVTTCLGCNTQLTLVHHEGEKDPNNHVGGYEVRDRVTATCTVEGYTGDTYCLACGEISRKGTSTELAPNNHVGGTYTRTENSHEADCVTAGSYDVVTYCAGCNKAISTEHHEGEKDMNKHVGGTRTEGAVTATCTAPGYTGNVYCLGCGNLISEGHATPVDGNNHVGGTWTEGVVVANCHTEGYTGDVYCLGCGSLITQGHSTDLAPTVHDGETELRGKVEANCHTQGYTGDLVCLGCQKVVTAGENTGFAPDVHDGETQTVTENVVGANCVTAGSYDEVTYCLGCNQKIGTVHKDGVLDPSNHVGDEHTERRNEVPATCSSSGYYDEVTICDSCGAEKKTVRKTVTRDYTNHVGEEHTEQRNQVAGNCRTAASYDLVTVCDSCGRVKTTVHMTGEKDPDKHVGGTRTARENEVPATCSAEGSYDEVTYCLGCSKQLKTETKPIPKIPHTAGDIRKDDVVDPTCTEQGSYYEVTFCAVCGEEYRHRTIMVKALGHDWGELTYVAEPTCTADGQGMHTCTRCGVSQLAEVKALGHDWGDWEVVTLPDYNQDGLERRTCARCGDTQENVLHIGSNKDRGVQFVAYNNTKFIVHTGDKDVIVNTNDARVIQWYSGATLNFDVQVSSAWAGDGFVVLVNQKELKPNADGSYTLPRGREYVIISIMPTSLTEPSDPGATPGSGGSSSGVCPYCGETHPSNLWGRIVAFIHQILYFFTRLFRR